MKLRTTKYIIKEGFINTYRNVLMSLASMGVVSASLIILGFFLVITTNIEHNTRFLKEQPEMQVFCNPSLDEHQVGMLQWNISRDERIEEFEKVDKTAAFEKAKKMLGDDSEILEGLDESIMPVSYIIKLKNSKDYEDIVEKYRNYPGVDSVQYSKKAIDFVNKILRVLQIGSSALIIILSAIAVFIISNTIKLTVFARRKEINIMKYIGATDWFIRWPFIVEGIIIGLVGAVVSFMIIYLVYRIGGGSIGNDMAMLELVSMGDMSFQLISTFCMLGAFVGALGSVISIQKYLRV
ncbi:permease-like cell division protein FtsX [Acetivibrio mesophilus]|uniref:Cell division protein FtsX n=1 Tax=Acetivibrio mesophilus TaxID=2487273 RepID=A0A4Q0I3W1_9FIRM|nr:permease-like cell division protein FtsX [Acetivibrio mesophilus]ODM26630.1 cell division protein FtsX [Clostridium sp. Bc-iso-3]RXE58938.1 ABC transporter permease [Acetivibrio mesophilus]HHV28492.1 ABC transporter permease [Clostridium sp.]